MNTIRERLVKVVVATESRRELLTDLNDGSFAVKVREPAKEGRANERVCVLIARHFKVPPTNVRIKNGHHFPRKLLTIRI